MIGVGDVLAVRTASLYGRLIRWAQGLDGTYVAQNHIAVVHHQDTNGTWWAIEGRPSGVGWASAAVYLRDHHTLTNERQAKTDLQRLRIAQIAQGLLGTPYDWQGILADAMDAIGAQAKWASDLEGAGPPGQLVCSSLAAWVYAQVGLSHPSVHPVRETTPEDWATWISEHAYFTG